MSWFQCFVLIIILAASTTTNASEVGIGNKGLEQVQQVLDVGRVTGASYLSFLNRIRDMLANTRTHNVAILAIAPNAIPPAQFNVVLRNGNREIRVKISAENLYLLGYERQNPRTWREIGVSGRHRINESGVEFLGFRESYDAMEHAAGPGTDRLSLSYTRRVMITAIDELQSTTVTTTVAKHLLLFTQVISEAARFTDISNRIANNILSSSSRLESFMTDNLQKNWQVYSNKIIFKECNPNYVFIGPVVQNNRRDTLPQLRNRFGILYRAPNTTTCPLRTGQDDSQLDQILMVAGA